MKYIDEFRDSKIAEEISLAIFKSAKGLRNINIMEVCGTHTMAVEKFGIRHLIPEHIQLISGPGCPVCVTPKYYIDKIVELSRIKNVLVTSFGDMIKVPGSYSSLREEMTRGNVKVVYSALDAVDIAEKNPDKKIVFLGIGFETTVPTVAASLVYSRAKKLRNFFVYSGHKIMPPAMKFLVNDRSISINGFLCPGHVSTIIGIRPYKEIANKYNIPCVISGFEPLDILQSILMLICQIRRKTRFKAENQYSRVVKESGNRKALRLIGEVFSVRDSEWRGIGLIPKSGLELKEGYSDFDAEKAIRMPEIQTRPDNKNCICGNVLKGINTPIHCRLFGKACTPEHPQGACMVSGEGTCAAYYRTRSRRDDRGG